MHKIEFKAMGCHMLAILDNPSTRSVERLARVPGWFEDWEQSLSRFRPESELSLLNCHAGEPVPVSPTLMEVFLSAVEAEKRSHGLVSPTLLDALVEAGYDQSFELLSPERTRWNREDPNWEFTTTAIEWRIDNHTLCLPPHVHLDFGGVAKGWAAHQAMQRLKSYGPVLVDAGGDIAISGLQHDQSSWPVAIADPFQPEADLDMLKLGRCGVATSGTDYRRWKQDGVLKHHIIDPRTGKPVETDILSATVIAPNVMEAEMATKVVLISGSQTGMEWLEANPTYAGMVVLENGDRLYSQQIEKYLWR
jgi:thiamine biosynthesis lipoprotein